jgi:SAM-dependent methyltransferase
VKPIQPAFANKSTVEEIRVRFDQEVERFSNLETGQQATIDAPLAMALIAEAAGRVNPHAKSLLDIGCGAGNYSLKMLERCPNMDVTLTDLSGAMLERAVVRNARMSFLQSRLLRFFVDGVNLVLDRELIAPFCRLQRELVIHTYHQHDRMPACVLVFWFSY